MSGLLYRLCYECGELVPYKVKIAGEEQYYLHACKKRNRIINWIEEDKKNELKK